MVKGNGLLIPTEVLLGYGCRNCVWKTYGQCPNGFVKPEESTDLGYCEEFADFLFRLAEGEDSLSAVKEKFMLYTQEMQAMADHTEFHKLKAEYDLRKSEGMSDRELKDLIIGLNMYKSWWSRLTDSVTKGLGRIADRERRSKDVETSSGKITVQQLNVMLRASSRYLEDKKDD